MKIRTLIAGAICLLATTVASAEISVNRTTNLTDDASGSASLATTGNFDEPGAALSTQAQFTNFHPGEKDKVSVTGSVTRALVRTPDTTSEKIDQTATYNGTLQILGTDASSNSTTTTLELQNVVVTRDGDGPEYSGTIVLNGTTIDASQMPDQAKHLVRRVLRLFRFD
jgi:hypothetical protein